MDRRSPSWRRIDDLLAGALERPAAERMAFVEAACDEPDVRSRVLRLLGAHERSDGIFAERTDVLASALAGEGALEAGAHLGSYRLLEPLGEGGMGAVYLAERDDGLYRQQVAIKVLHPASSRDARLRFDAERQILARLRHPNIARILDGGETEAGRPFLVMERVEGEPIDTFSDRSALSVEERLRLVVAVCRAVAYAHSNLLVHRDLKPSNILVTSEGEPVLLDFGIAKLLDPEGRPVDAGLTSTGARPMSLAYASPEQVLGEAVTTASDTYALGVLLYELLTGQSPYRGVADGSQALERAVREQRPLAASMAVAEPPEGRDPREIASARRLGPNELRRRLRGDLDTILEVALRKSARRRYRTAEALAEDLERHLSHRPVRARPDTPLYRLRRFVRRNRLVVSTSAALVASLAGLAVTTTTSAVRIAKERDAAERERIKATSVSNLLTELFEEANPASLASVDESLTVREVLDRGVAKIALLDGQPALQAAHLTTMGKGYRNLGLLAAAEPLLERALALREAAEPRDALDLAASLDELGGLRQDQGQLDKARALFEEALALRREHPDATGEELGESLNNLALVLYLLGDFEAAEPLYREALPLVRAMGGKGFELSVVLNNLGIILHAKGDYEGAEPLYREALDVREALPPSHPWVAISVNNLGTLLRDRGDLAAAEPVLLEALDMRQIHGEDHPGVLGPTRNLALLRFLEGRLEESARLYREGLAIARSVDPEHPMTAMVLSGLARVELALGERSSATRRLEEALPILHRRLPADHWRRAYAEALLAVCHGEGDEAALILRSRYDAIVAKLGPREPRSRDVAGLLAEHYENRGVSSESARYRARASLEGLAAVAG